MKITVCDISGMGGRQFGGYEWGCQVICARALRFLQKATESAEFPKFHGYKNITGLLVGDNAAAKQLDDFILQHEKLREFGMTGAMHQFGIIHALKIHELGREGYLRELRTGEGARGPEDFYEFDESEAFPEEPRSLSIVPPQRRWNDVCPRCGHVHTGDGECGVFMGRSAGHCRCQEVVSA